MIWAGVSSLRRLYTACSQAVLQYSRYSDTSKLRPIGGDEPAFSSNSPRRIFLAEQNFEIPNKAVLQLQRLNFARSLLANPGGARRAYSSRSGPLKKQLDTVGRSEGLVAWRFPAVFARAVASGSDSKMARNWANSWVIRILSSYILDGSSGKELLLAVKGLQNNCHVRSLALRTRTRRLQQNNLERII